MGYVSPIGNLPENIVQGFGQTGASFEPGGWHNGVDLSIPQGSTLYAVTDGTIGINTNWTTPGHPIGWAVVLHGSDGQDYTYGHVSRFLSSVGQRVTAGEPIALSGGAPGTQGAGNSTGPHLHFQIGTGKGVDPTGFLSGAVNTVQAAFTGGTRPVDAKVPSGINPCNPTSNFLDGASGIGWFVGLIRWAGQPCIYKRFVLYGISGGLVIWGLKFVGHPGPSKVIVKAAQAPVEAVKNV